jgi:hypothetical protein
MKTAIDLKFNRGLVWATLRGPVAHAQSEPLNSRVQAFARLVSCWRILIDCRSLVVGGTMVAPDWQQSLLGQLRLPEGARAALVFDALPVLNLTQLRIALTQEQTAAVFTDLRAAVRWLRAVDALPQARRRKAMQLGAIKELLHQFARARRDADKAQLARELGELYSFLLEQARHMGIDPQRAIDLNRARAARWRPRLVHSRDPKPRTSRH